MALLGLDNPYEMMIPNNSSAPSTQLLMSAGGKKVPKKSNIAGKDSPKKDSPKKDPMKKDTKTVVCFKSFTKLCKEQNATFDKTHFNDYTKEILASYVNKHMSEMYEKSYRTKLIQILLVLYPAAILKISEHSEFEKIFHKVKLYIDSTIVDNFNRNWLYNLRRYSLIMQVLNSDMQFNINHGDINGNTFVTQYFSYCQINTKDFMTLVAALRKRNYNFNNLGSTGKSIFSLPFNGNTKNLAYNLLVKIIEMPEVNITMELFWLKVLLQYITNGYIENHNFSVIVATILNRSDYVSFLYNVVSKYHHVDAENDIFKLLLKVHHSSPQKLKEMLEYIDKTNGNTFMHKAACLRYKNVLKIIPEISKLEIGPNKEGYYPHDLYKRYKISNTLKSMEKVESLI